MSRKFYIIAIFLLILIVAVNVYFYSSYKQNIIITFGPGNTMPTETTTVSENIPPRFIEKNCNSNSDCSWNSTNCCAEKTGAKWECINGKTFQSGCPKNILCPQFLSPKPSSTCVCDQGNCVEK